MERTINEIYELIKEKIDNAKRDYIATYNFCKNTLQNRVSYSKTLNI